MFLRDKPIFRDIAGAFLEFVGDAPLVAHNSEFDRRFLNSELLRIGRDPLHGDRVIDTLKIARKRFPGAANSLDALAKRFQLDRFGFDLSARKGAGGHGALVDAKMLAEVYLQLNGGREQRLAFEDDAQASRSATERAAQFARRPKRPKPLPPRGSKQERDAHGAFVAELGAQALWLKYGK
jgi:DNA polymerase-3 subunit epsilon